MNSKNKSAILSFTDYPKDPVVLDKLSIKFMKQYAFVTLEIVNNTLRIAMADPADYYTIRP